MNLCENTYETPCGQYVDIYAISIIIQTVITTVAT